MLHVRVPIKGISVNRRERVVDHRESAMAQAKAMAEEQEESRVQWFEKAGRTRLGQRPSGPKVEFADLLCFLGTVGEREKVVGVFTTYSMHPTINGKRRLQGADFW